MKMTIPNILTLFRLLAAPGVVVAFVLLPRPLADWVAFALFVGASVTDYLDGYLARKWNQISRIGTMLDPIADKAMVAIALLALMAWSPLALWAVIPGAVILFREVFVSGLREFLGDVAGTLKVTNLAKWKTAVQMVAIALLLAQGGFAASHTGGAAGASLYAQGQGAPVGAVGYLGVALIWVAAVLTGITGWDYFAKARAHLGED